MPFAHLPAAPAVLRVIGEPLRGGGRHSRMREIAHLAALAHRTGHVPVLVRESTRRPARARRPLTLRCVLTAARVARVPRDLTMAILWVEGGKVGGMRHNHNGSYDLGPMQINTLWLGVLERVGFTPVDLVYNGCANVLAGAMILRFYFDDTGDLVQAVGDYHSKIPRLSTSYILRVSRFLTRYYSGRVASREVIERANGPAPE